MRQVEHRVATSRLHVLHRGVYNVGHEVPTPRGRWMAAALACGDEALLSHRSAAALWDLLPTATTNVDVIAKGHSRRGIRVHQTRMVHSDDRAERSSIPVTSLARTIVDLAGMIGPSGLRKAIDRADRLRLLDLVELNAARERSNGRRGTKALGQIMDNYRPPPFLRSALEHDFLELCRRAGIPAPAMNAIVAGLEVDAVWPEPRLVVELDGYEFHKTRAAFERDRHRDAILQTAGYRVVRLTARRIDRDLPEVVAVMRRLLGTRV